LNVVLNIVNYRAWQICRIGTWCDFSMICGWLSWLLDYIAPASCDHWESRKWWKWNMLHAAIVLAGY
jgi:hypothetical protein